MENLRQLAGVSLRAAALSAPSPRFRSPPLPPRSGGRLRIEWISTPRRNPGRQGALVWPTLRTIRFRAAVPSYANASRTTSRVDAESGGACRRLAGLKPDTGLDRRALDEDAGGRTQPGARFVPRTGTTPRTRPSGRAPSRPHPHPARSSPWTSLSAPGFPGVRRTACPTTFWSASGVPKLAVYEPAGTEAADGGCNAQALHPTRVHADFGPTRGLTVPSRSSSYRPASASRIAGRGEDDRPHVRTTSPFAWAPSALPGTEFSSDQRGTSRRSGRPVGAGVGVPDPSSS